MGWGGQGGTCQLTLVEDPQTDPAKNKVIPKFDDEGNRDDVNGKPFIGDEDGAYDPRLSPLIGTAVGLRYGDPGVDRSNQFYFGGIFQRYTYAESLSGRTYNIILESPAKLFDGIQVILDEFQGTIFSPVNAFYGGGPWQNYGEAPDQFTYGEKFGEDYVYNVWNVFAELENYAFNDTTGGNFGNADVNSVGIPVLKLLDILQKFGDDDANAVFGGPAQFGSSSYKFDFSELREAVEATAPDYRVKGPVSNLNGILSDICETIQYQYFPQIIGPSGTDDVGTLDTNGIANPTVKIKMIDMGKPPQPGIIDDLVNDVKSQGKLISSAVGKELQNATTQKVVVGGAATRYYDAPVSSFFSVFKKSTSGTYVPDTLAVARYASKSHKNTVPLQFPDQFGGATYNASIFEMRMSLAGMEAWEIYKAFQTMLELEGGDAEPNSTLYIGDYPPWFSRVFTTKALLEQIAGFQTNTLDLMNSFTGQAAQAFEEEQKKRAQEMYNVVNKAASEYYGQVFFAPLPYEIGGRDNNFRWISEDFQYEASWEICDSAWYYDIDSGEESYPVADVMSYDGEGRLKAHSTFLPNGISDFSALGSDYAVGFGGRLVSTKGGPDKDLYWQELDGELVQPYALVRTGAQIRTFDNVTTPDFGLTVLADLFFGLDIPPAAYIDPGKQGAQIPIPPGVALPISIGVPQLSNRYRWGPWYAYGKDGETKLKNGKAEVIIDDNLRPETFGSSELLNQAAFATAFSGIGNLQAVESGYVEVAEFPSFNVGDRWADQGPYVTDVQIDISLDGCKCTYKFNTWTPNFGKLAKYNMDRIARINQSSLAFAQRYAERRERRPLPSLSFVQSDFGGVKIGGHKFSSLGIQTINGIMRTIFN